jgi:hypothetical protein
MRIRPSGQLRNRDRGRESRTNQEPAPTSHNLLPAFAVFQQTAKEALGGSCVPPILHQDVEHDTVLVHRTPEIVECAVGPDEHLIQVPDVTWSWPASAEPLGELRPEFPAPSADALVGHEHASFGQDQLDIPQDLRILTEAVQVF